MGLDFGYGSPGCGEADHRPSIIARIHFLHFTIILFVICFLATIIISKMTTPIDAKHTIRLTWWTRHSKKFREDFPEERIRQEKVEQSLKEKLAKPKDEPTTPVPKWRKFLYLLCGYEPPVHVEMTEEEVQEQKKVLTSIEEKGFWKHFVNVNAILLMAFGLFLWGFFA